MCEVEMSVSGGAHFCQKTVGAPHSQMDVRAILSACVACSAPVHLSFIISISALAFKMRASDGGKETAGPVLLHLS